MLTTILALSLSALLHITGALTETLHMDAFPVTVEAAMPLAAMPYPLLCLPTDADYTITFVWRLSEGQDAAQVDMDARQQRLRPITEAANGIFYRDSDRADEVRLPRWATTANCQLDIKLLAHDASSNYNQPFHKTIFIEPADDYCGYAYLWHDDRPGIENAHNMASRAFVTERCLTPYVVAHELMHLLGAVQTTAPHFIEGWHTDERGDIMSIYGMIGCPSRDTIDCGKDDYFSLAPAPDSYLATRWNTANNVYLTTVRRQVTYVPLSPVAERID